MMNQSMWAIFSQLNTVFRCPINEPLILREDQLPMQLFIWSFSGTSPVTENRLFELKTPGFFGFFEESVGFLRGGCSRGWGITWGALRIRGED